MFHPGLRHLQVSQHCVHVKEQFYGQMGGALWALRYCQRVAKLPDDFIMHPVEYHVHHLVLLLFLHQ